MKFMRMREMRDLSEDPKFQFMVGRLVGAAEMMALYTTLHGDQKMRGMAGRVYETLYFFFDPKEHRELPVPADQEVTEIVPPK